MTLAVAGRSQGPDAAHLLETICVAKVGGDTPVGNDVYTRFLDAKGGVRADLTVLRLGQDHYRVIDGADAAEHSRRARGLDA